MMTLFRNPKNEEYFKEQYKRGDFKIPTYGIKGRLVGYSAFAFLYFLGLMILGTVFDLFLSSKSALIILISLAVFFGVVSVEKWLRASEKEWKEWAKKVDTEQAKS